MGDVLCRGGGDVGDGFWTKILSGVRRQGEQCPGEARGRAVFSHRTEQPIPLVSCADTSRAGCAQLDPGRGNSLECEPGSDYDARSAGPASTT